MYITLMKSKIHRAHVTEANLNYIGSITIDEDLMETAGLIEYEKVLVLNINNGNRFETYVMAGERGSGTICINGAAARLVLPGDLVIILAFGTLSEDEAKIFKPNIVFVDENNKIKE